MHRPSTPLSYNAVIFMQLSVPNEKNILATASRGKTVKMRKYWRSLNMNNINPVKWVNMLMTNFAI